MKHSGATAARVALRDGGGVLNITVEDNGRGFDPEGARMGHGLSNIRERAARLGGEAAITSSDGAGTKVALSIPVAVVAQ